MNYKEYFKGKRVTQMGLGLLGRGVGDAAFLAECGAELIVTDKKSVEELAPSIDKLKDFPQIKFKLGGHDLADFKDRDFILKAAGVLLDSIEIREARKNYIPIEMDASLFVKLAPENVFVIGVTGTRGKSTVTHLIYHILETAGKKAYLGGNVRDSATLPLLKEINPEDADRQYVVLELDSWQLQGFGDSRISPNISVFTAFMKDHMNYYASNISQYFEDKSNIYKFQKKGDVLVAGEGVAEIIMGKPHGEGDFVLASKNSVPSDFHPQIIGEHNMLNISCAIEVAKRIGIDQAKIKKAVESFTGVEGRLQFVKEVKGVKIYNDNNSTTPEATIAAIKSFDPKNIILICGGVDKNLPLDELEVEMQKCKKIILLPGTGTDKLKVEGEKVESLSEAVAMAISVASVGDTILFSPGFASFGLFKNEYDRNDQFLKIVEDLK